ncbi:hypothetical protein HCC36_10970 [Listeria booriae]|uniref:Uncharacterized protein n=1 Tax=Listeria booriae TaxID=1552123 RepID=A0A842GAC3_9LIST|nr:hypothetical protein [Listeria booriae]MBC2293750.1 hypothetical protein [Listeria booriae]
MEEAKTILINPKSLDIFNNYMDGRCSARTPIIVNGCKLGAGVIGYDLHSVADDKELIIAIKYHERMITDEFREKILNADNQKELGNMFKNKLDRSVEEDVRFVTHDGKPVYLAQLYKNSTFEDVMDIKVLELHHNGSLYIREDLIGEKAEESTEKEGSSQEIFSGIEELSSEAGKIVTSNGKMFIIGNDGSCRIWSKEGLYVIKNGNPLDAKQLIDKDGRILV